MHKQNNFEINLNRIFNSCIEFLFFSVGTVYSLPPLWKRVAAEIIDFIVLFYLKIMMTVLVLRHMGYL